MVEELFCSECKKSIDIEQFYYIDDKPVCYKCIFGDVKPVKIYPIGLVASNEPWGNAIITLYSQQKRFMYKLEEETEICVVFYFHEIDSIKTVFNRGKRSDGKRVGVFASRTPRRTSRIGITNVQLLEVSGLELKVKGLDAFPGSPVLDIKAIGKVKKS